MTINVFGGGFNPAAPAFPLQRSVRLRSSASAYFNRTPASAGNRQTWTWSGWVKRGALGATSSQLFGAYIGSGTTDTNYFEITFFNDVVSVTGYATVYRRTSAIHRDPSAWYHIVVAVDTTQATGSNRIKIYVNGVQVTAFGTSNDPTQNVNLGVNGNYPHGIGAIPANAAYFDGYLTEVNFIDGQALTPSSFGSINSTTGVWQPIKYTSTYGANGFYLNFQDNSNNTATTIGKDSSGNGNNWTPNGISVTAGVTYDSMLDVPTLTSATNANFAVMNPLDKGTTVTVQNANLQSVIAATHNGVRGTFQIPTSGKWYWEVAINTTTTNSIIGSFGVATASASLNTYDYNTTGTYSLYCQGSPALNFIVNGSIGTTFGSAVTGGTVCNVAYDADNGQLYLGVANTYYSSAGAGTGNPATATNPSMAVAASLGLFPYIHVYNETIDVNFGQRPFTHPVPSGFKSLNTYNLPAPTIPNGATQFAVSLWSGNNSTQSITNTVNGKSFQPDLVWLKQRSPTGTGHILEDSVRGALQYLGSESTAAESTIAGTVTAFNSNGFSIGSQAGTNATGSTYVGWQWKASNAAAVTNTSGSITSSVSANPTAGFSIVTFTTPASGNFTVGHGLGIAPAMVILKTRSGVDSWYVYNKNFATPTTGYLQLNSTAAVATSVSLWGSTNPTSSVVTLGTGGGIAANATGLLYCFSEIAGYSKFGSYTGNGSTDGPFVYLGFRPKFIMWKRTDTTGSWYLYDTSRSAYNASVSELYPNLSNAEGTSTTGIDILSNGWKIRTSGASDPQVNASGGTYIFMAVAESPFNYSLAR